MSSCFITILDKGLNVRKINLWHTLPMRAFVTGGTGFLGRTLIQELLAHGYQVTALVRTIDRARLLPEKVQCFPGNIVQPATLRRAMQAAEVVFHLAAWRKLAVRKTDVERLHRINVEGTRQVLELAGELSVPKIVHVSSINIYGATAGQAVDETYHPEAPDLLSEYARSKHQAHWTVARPLQAQGLPILIACPSQVYGPGDVSLIGQLLPRRLPIWIGPETTLSWAYVEDIAVGLRLLAERGQSGETYHLAGPALNYREFFATAERVLGWHTPKLWLPASLARLLAGAGHKVAPHYAELFRAFSGFTQLARSDKAHRELSWQARSVEAGMQAWARQLGT